MKSLAVCFLFFCCSWSFNDAAELYGISLGGLLSSETDILQLNSEGNPHSYWGFNITKTVARTKQGCTFCATSALAQNEEKGEFYFFLQQTNDNNAEHSFFTYSVGDETLSKAAKPFPEPMACIFYSKSLDTIVGISQPTRGHPENPRFTTYLIDSSDGSFKVTGSFGVNFKAAVTNKCAYDPQSESITMLVVPLEGETAAFYTIDIKSGQIISKSPNVEKLSDLSSLWYSAGELHGLLFDISYDPLEVSGFVKLNATTGNYTVTSLLSYPGQLQINADAPWYGAGGLTAYRYVESINALFIGPVITFQGFQSFGRIDVQSGNLIAYKLSEYLIPGAFVYNFAYL
eukprot:TRINITY_DN5008_c0_g4_i1.p1 TRINITY_DN5008_c0_g4~~TRINITY_DN5008_c0_g4_i1.p1  ORF type:complete len:345 (+),score=28.72 TRINITY_DN5008_c0_g4_i1:91-1125(+)